MIAFKRKEICNELLDEKGVRCNLTYLLSSFNGDLSTLWLLMYGIGKADQSEANSHYSLECWLRNLFQIFSSVRLSCYISWGQIESRPKWSKFSSISFLNVGYQMYVSYREYVSFKDFHWSRPSSWNFEERKLRRLFWQNIDALHTLALIFL